MIDASVVVLARQRGVRVVTSDPDDCPRLDEERFATLVETLDELNGDNQSADRLL